MTTNRVEREQQSSGQKNMTIPLLKIPQARVQIYADCIIKKLQPFSQQRTAESGQFQSVADNKIDEAWTKERYTLAESKQDRELNIRFNNPDFAFNIDQSDKRIEIHDLSHHTIPLQFKVNSLQTLLTVQSLFRRKMCELGFETKYRMLQVLGKGATAVVHLVERVSDKKLFAAKIISIKQANDKSYETFINESKLLRILRHKNIIHLESLYIHKKQLIQVIEYLSGGTLLQLIKNDQLKTKKEKWKVLRDITYGLDYLRQRRIVHRDIKMENILIRVNGDQKQYVISDFGLAVWVGESNPLFERCGTPGYIAPEVLNAPKGKAILNHKIDIFSLGAIAHVVFLHQPLFPYSGNIKDLLKLNKKADFSLNSPLYQDLTLSEINFLQITLTKDPSLRCEANEVIEDIKYISQESLDFSAQKSHRKNNNQKIKVQQKNYGVEVQVKKQTSLTKNKISLNDSSSKQQSTQKRPVSSARKLFSEVWASLTTPSPRKQKLRIKQNSVEKQKKLTQYFS